MGKKDPQNAYFKKGQLTIAIVDQLADAIELAVAFLIRRQLPSGEFPTCAASEPDMDAPVLYGSPFISAFVVFALRYYAGIEWPESRMRALQFLLSEVEPGGWWRNHNRLNPLHSEHKLPLDLDDTAVISQLLAYYDVSFEDNRSDITLHINEQSLFLTWIQPPFTNEADPVVNANVLFYLGTEGLPNASKVVEWLAQGGQDSLWYPDRLVLYYVIARAFANGVDALNTLRTRIIEDILTRQQDGGGFGSDLRTALALNCLKYFDYRGPQLETAIRFLLQRQAMDGSWAIGPFYRGWKKYYGSAELTTALAVEALLSP